MKTKKLVMKNLKHFILDECDKMLAELDMRRDVQASHGWVINMLTLMAVSLVVKCYDQCCGSK